MKDYCTHVPRAEIEWSEYPLFSMIVPCVSFSRPKHAKFDLQGPTIVYFHLLESYPLKSINLPLKIKMYQFGMLHWLCQMYHFARKRYHCVKIIIFFRDYRGV